MRDKFKGIVTDDAFFYAVLLVLVGLVAFGLGRQSVAEIVATTPPVQVFPGAAAVQVVKATESVTTETTVIPPASVSDTTTANIAVVASRSGTKYHLPDCPGAKQIKETNVITFASIDLARAAGYEPAKNCPGLQ